MDDYSQAINISFENAFEHYKKQLISKTLEFGYTEPVVCVLHMNQRAHGTGTAYEIAGEMMSPTSDIKMRDFIKLLGKKYGKKLVAGNRKDLPVAILCFAEAYMGKAKKQSDTSKPLQDKNGKPINGAVEKYIVSGFTATGNTHFLAYDIIRKEDGTIIDLVQDEDIKESGIESVMLQGFYTELAEVLEKAGKFDDLKKEK